MALNTLAHEGSGGRPILTLNKVEQPPVDRPPHPCIEQARHSAPASAIQLFELALWRDRNEWDVNRRKLLVQAFAALGGVK